MNKFSSAGVGLHQRLGTVLLATAHCDSSPAVVVEVLEAVGSALGESRKKRTGVPDAKRAIRWYKQQADELGIDPERIIAGGGSAGGHICLVATNNPGLNDPQDSKEFDASVAAYILFNPALSKGDASDPEIDVIQHLKADFPPAIAFFGSKDKWLEGWNPAYEKLKSMGNDNVNVQMAEGEGHAFFNYQPWADITLTAALRILKKLGYLEGEPTLPAAPDGEKLIEQPRNQTAWLLPCPPL